MKKSRLIQLFLMSLVFIFLSSCNNSDVGTNDYPKTNEVSNYKGGNDYIRKNIHYYTYDATFENGIHKSYMLNRNVNAMVVGNCLIFETYDFKERSFLLDYCGTSAYNAIRFILDIEKNVLTIFKQNQRPEGFRAFGYLCWPRVYKEVIEVSKGSIDRWVKENLASYIIYDYDYNDHMDYSYTETRYSSDYGSSKEDYVNSYDSKYDVNGNRISEIVTKGNYSYKKEYTYNKNNQLIKEEYYVYHIDYVTLAEGYELNTIFKYTYDSSSRLIKKEVNEVFFEYEYYYEYGYDEKNNLISEKEFSQNNQDGFMLFYETNYEYDSFNNLILETKTYNRDNNMVRTSNSRYLDYDYRKEFKYENSILVYDKEELYIGDHCYNTYLSLYDEEGKLTSKTNCEEASCSSKIAYEYDSNGILICESVYTLEDSEWIISKQYKYIYDSNFNLLEYTLSGNRFDCKYLYTYDSNGFVAKVEQYDTSSVLVHSFEWQFEGTNCISYTEFYKGESDTFSVES